MSNYLNQIQMWYSIGIIIEGMIKMLRFLLEKVDNTQEQMGIVSRESGIERIKIKCEKLDSEKKEEYFGGLRVDWIYWR